MRRQAKAAVPYAGTAPRFAPPFLEKCPPECVHLQEKCESRGSRSPLTQPTSHGPGRGRTLPKAAAAPPRNPDLRSISVLFASRRNLCGTAHSLLISPPAMNASVFPSVRVPGKSLSCRVIPAALLLALSVPGAVQAQQFTKIN